MKELQFKKIFKNKRLIIFLITFILLVVLALTTIALYLNKDSELPPNKTSPHDRAVAAISEIEDYYRENVAELDSWWELVALWGIGVDIVSADWGFAEWFNQEPDPEAPATEYAGLIFGLTAIGENPALFWPEQNLFQQLAEKQQDDGSFGGGINNTIWGIIALSVAPDHYFLPEKKEKALEYLISSQKEDGGFAYSGEVGDSDMTAMAIQALSLSKDIELSAESLEKSLNFIKMNRLSGGGFASFGQENANSIAVVISALVAAGEDLLSEKWTLIDELLSYRLADGSFTFSAGNDLPDKMATYQALIALGDFVDGKSLWQRLGANIDHNDDSKIDDSENEEPADEEPESAEADNQENQSEQVANETTADNNNNDIRRRQPPPTNPDTPDNTPVPAPPDNEDEPPDNNLPGEDDEINENLMAINLKVIGKNGTYFNNRILIDKNKNTAIQSLDGSGLSYKTAYGGMYVSEIAGEKENLNTGAGWKFKVNGIIPGTAASSYYLKENDNITWWYALTPDCPGP